MIISQGKEVAHYKIGFIGMGLMGIPMSLRLLQAGHDVMVWNRSADKTQPVVNAGAKHAQSLQQLAEHSDIIMTCIADTQAVESLMFGEFGLADCLQDGQIVIDFSSIDPAATGDFAARLMAKNVHWIDAPVSGGVAGAEQGTLAIMAGGDEQVIDSVRTLLDPLSQRVTRMGGVGSGQVTKICNQMIVSCNVLVMAEVMALAEKSGVDSNMIAQALKGGFADSIPLQLTGPRMAQRDYDPVKWRVKTLSKDLDMANALAKDMLSAVPMAGLGAELMRQHASKGFNEQDPCTLIEMYTPDNNNNNGVES